MIEKSRLSYSLAILSDDPKISKQATDSLRSSVPVPVISINQKYPMKQEKEVAPRKGEKGEKKDAVKESESDSMLKLEDIEPLDPFNKDLNQVRIM